ncbi:MAG: 50S ribosome-binding GTPase [Clostridium sp.]|nr:MAG: 50S ribosome-binding GTPase [Clostridium sp.]
MIVGIPNVGKSTLINVLAKRKSLPVGDKPGVTKAQAWLKVTDDFMLLDTPGILWPKFEDQMTGVKLAICGAIKEEILDMHEIAKVALEIVKDQYPKAILERYNIENANEIEVLDLIEQIGRRRGAITKGNVVDIDRSIDIFITDLQKGRLGRISYEYPEI